MIGNPHYIPEYEKYYSHERQAPIDRIISPRNKLYLENLAKRTSVPYPILPVAAMVLPLAALGYKSMTKYRKHKVKNIQAEIEAETTRRNLSREQIYKRMGEEKQRKLLAGILTEVSRPRLMPSPSGGPRLIPTQEESLRQPIISIGEGRLAPPMPKVHVDLPSKLSKDKLPGGTINEIDAYAMTVVNKIREQGLDRVIRDPAIDDKHRQLLADIPAALLSRNYFPKPYYSLLDDQTKLAYESVEKKIKKATPEEKEQKRLYNTLMGGVSRKNISVPAIIAGVRKSRGSRKSHGSRKSAVSKIKIPKEEIQDIKKKQMFDMYRSLYDDLTDDQIMDMVEKSSYKKK